MKTRPANSVDQPADPDVTHKLELKGVHKRYGEVVALKPTSLAVKPGEFLTLLGPSGSGKTTLLQLIAGLIAPTGGEIWLDRKPTVRQPPHKRDIGLVFQNYALFPHLTASENIAFPLKMRGMNAGEINRRVERMLDLVQLPHVADRFPRELSGGQQQRIALARCAVYEPSIILMDEPLGALDKALREDMQFEIKRIHRELGATILYVTHDQEEAMAMSDRICLMRNGGIEQLGTPRDLYFSPKGLFAATFLGHSNIFPGVVVARSLDCLRVRLHSGVEFVARGDQAVGTGVGVLLRPEAIRVLDGADNSSPGLDAELELSVIVGSISRRHWRLADGSRVVQIELTSHSDSDEALGRRARLSWAPGSAVAIDVEGQT